MTEARPLEQAAGRGRVRTAWTARSRSSNGADADADVVERFGPVDAQVVEGGGARVLVGFTDVQPLGDRVVERELHRRRLRQVDHVVDVVPVVARTTMVQNPGRTVVVERAPRHSNSSRDRSPSPGR